MTSGACFQGRKPDKATRITAQAERNLTYIPAPNRKAQSRMDRVVARWLWDRFIQKRVPWIGLAVVFMVLEAGMLGAFSYLVQPMFDDVLVAGDRGACCVRGVGHGLCVLRAWRGAAGA